MSSDTQALVVEGALLVAYVVFVIVCVRMDRRS